MTRTVSKAALIVAALLVPNFSLSDSSGSSAVTNKGIILMDHNPNPDTGTDLFYFVHFRKTGSLVPQTNEELSYSALPLAEVFHKARYDEQGRIIYEELWQRDRRPVPEGLLVDGQPVSAFPAARIGHDLKTQTPLFYVYNSETESYEPVEYALTTGESNFLRMRLRKDILKEGLFVSAELVQQRLDSKRVYDYTAEGGISKITEWSRSTDFRRVETVFNR